MGLEKHLLRDGLQTIVVTVRGKPALAWVDPRHVMIDKVRRDSLMAVGK